MAAALETVPDHASGQRAGRGRGPARVLAAIVAALTMAALGAWLGWRGAPALPSDAAAVELIQPAAPAAQFAVTVRQEAPFAYEHPDEPLTWLIGNDDYNAGWVGLTVSGTNPGSLRAGLEAQGWHTSDDPYPPTAGGFAASKGEWSLEVRPGVALTVDLARAEPGRVGPLTVAGYVLGLAAGALLALGVRRLGLAALVAGLVLLLPGTVLTTGDLVFNRTLPADVTPPALWGDYLFFGVRLLSTAGVVLLAAALPLGRLSARR
nr:hypothetical protein GCM10020063_055690 [Dactylosporangium thailandense]